MVAVATLLFAANCSRGGFDATYAQGDSVSSGDASFGTTGDPGTVECAPGSVCAPDEHCLPVGATQACVPVSNVPRSATALLREEGLDALDLNGVAEPVYVDTDDGGIVDGDGDPLRQSGIGLIDGIFFGVYAQVENPALDAAVFVMEDVRIPSGTNVVVIGSNPLVLLVRQRAVISGTLDVGARGEAAEPFQGHHLPGPGGAEGGADGLAGEGCGGGGAGSGEDCDTYTTSGGSGGGFGGMGAPAGDGAFLPHCPTQYPGGAAGQTCGSAMLEPLVGGSGGGSGGIPGTSPSIPGSGGAGGGAIQIVALDRIELTATGLITSPGGGGAGATNDGGGGGGGGSGGAILLQAPTISLLPGSALAVNGGGGGGGDCS